MDFFDGLNLIGGLCLFLFGMTLMGQALERRAGNGLKLLLGRLTTNKFAGLFTGLAVTAVIQSSSATTVMVVGFVNSGLMTLKQSIELRAHDAQAVDPCHHGREYRYYCNRLDIESRGNRQQEFLCQHVEAFIVYADPCIDWHYFLYDVEEQQAKRYRLDTAWLYNVDVWYGNHVRSCFRTSECA